MKYTVGYLTDEGIRRSENEDSICVIQPQSYNMNMAPLCVAVADGVGGHVRGEMASKIAIDALQKVTSDDNFWELDARAQIINSIKDSNREIFNKTGGHGGHRMCTTMTVAVFKEAELKIGHVGDSRTYLIRKRSIKQLTRDHSWVQNAIEQGILDSANAKKHPNRHIITRAVGYNKDIDVDVYEYEIMNHDLIVLCSDGLTDVVSEKEIYKTVKHSRRVKKSCEKLVKMANRKGGPDNISVIIVKVEENQ